jgi:hypothetical protein
MTMKFKSADDGDKKALARCACIFPRSTLLSTEYVCVMPDRVHSVKHAAFYEADRILIRTQIFAPNIESRHWKKPQRPQARNSGTPKVVGHCR